MKGVDRDENHVIVLIHQLHHLIHPSFVVPHSHQTAEYTHSVVDMYNVVPYIESTQVIESQLFTLFNSTPEADPVEAVENLVVGVAADLVLIVNETPVNILSDDELREQASRS